MGIFNFHVLCCHTFVRCWYLYSWITFFKNLLTFYSFQSVNFLLAQHINFSLYKKLTPYFCKMLTFYLKNSKTYFQLPYTPLPCYDATSRFPFPRKYSSENSHGPRFLQPQITDHSTFHPRYVPHARNHVPEPRFVRSIDGLSTETFLPYSPSESRREKIRTAPPFRRRVFNFPSVPRVPYKKSRTGITVRPVRSIAHPDKLFILLSFEIGARENLHGPSRIDRGGGSR